MRAFLPGWFPQGMRSLEGNFRSSVEELERLLAVAAYLFRQLAFTRNSRIVSEPGHGATNVFEFWGHDGTNYVKAQASMSGEQAIGMAVNIPGPDHLEIAVAGWITWESHGLTLGKHWLSTSTPGATQTTPPGPGTRVQLVMHVLDTDNLILFPTEAFP